jgi:hypothetical protein
VAVLLVGVVMAAFLAVRWKLVQVYGSAVTYGGLWVWLVVSGLVVGFLRVGSYLFTIPFLIAIGLTFLPPRLKLVRLIPAIVATLLLAPNIALSYLGAGLQPLVLVTFLVAMNMELRAEAGLSAQ